MALPSTERVVSETIEMTAIITAIDGKADMMEQALQILEEKTNGEDGCIEFKIFRSNGNPNRFILWEVFSNEDALNLHLAKDYTVEYFGLGLGQSTEVIRHTKI